MTPDTQTAGSFNLSGQEPRVRAQIQIPRFVVLIYRLVFFYLHRPSFNSYAHFYGQSPTGFYNFCNLKYYLSFLEDHWKCTK